MSCCTHCRDAGDFFDLKNARKELHHYKKKGAITSTRLLIDALKSLEVNGKSLLDIGGGVGIIQHELFGHGLSRSVQVDASRAYLEVSRDESARLGFDDQTEYHYGDFVDLSPDLPDADLVTLDRVICCYPHMPELIAASTSKAKTWYGVVYPVERWYTRWGVKLVNLYFKLTKSDFRVYVHPEGKIESRITGQGFSAIYKTKTLLWNIAVYQKSKV